jgi:hypothetical protein
MDILGQIWNSALNDPTTWTALGFIAVDPSIGTGVALVRHLDYIVAFGTQGTQFFYDAANPSPGSPLGALPNAKYDTGCAVPESIVQMTGLTIFVSRTQQAGRAVTALQGLTMASFSDAYIEKILANDPLTNVKSMGLRVAGHNFYLLTLPTSNVTLVLDLGTKTWQVWASGAYNYFSPAFAISGRTNVFVPDTTLLLHETNGNVYEMLPSYVTDNGATITCLIRTPILDTGNMNRKFLPAMHLIGDTVSATIAVSYSDDDYTTFSTPRTIDLSTVRKMLRHMGSFRRRSFDLVFTASQRFRARLLEFPF